MNDLPMLDPEPLLKKALRRRETAWYFYLKSLHRHNAVQTAEWTEEFRFWDAEVKMYGRLVKEVKGW